MLPSCKLSTAMPVFDLTCCLNFKCIWNLQSVTFFTGQFVNFFAFFVQLCCWKYIYTTCATLLPWMVFFRTEHLALPKVNGFAKRVALPFCNWWACLLHKWCLLKHHSMCLLSCCFHGFLQLNHSALATFHSTITEKECHSPIQVFWHILSLWQCWLAKPLVWAAFQVMENCLVWNFHWWLHFSQSFCSIGVWLNHVPKWVWWSLPLAQKIFAS